MYHIVTWSLALVLALVAFKINENEKAQWLSLLRIVIFMYVTLAMMVLKGGGYHVFLSAFPIAIEGAVALRAIQVFHKIVQKAS